MATYVGMVYCRTVHGAVKSVRVHHTLFATARPNFYEIFLLLVCEKKNCTRLLMLEDYNLNFTSHRCLQFLSLFINKNKMGPMENLYIRVPKSTAEHVLFH